MRAGAQAMEPSQRLCLVRLVHLHYELHPARLATRFGLSDGYLRSLWGDTPRDALPPLSQALELLERNPPFITVNTGAIPMAKLNSPEEHGREKKVKSEKSEAYDGGGFPEGTHGRGPMPYTKGMSPKPNGHGAEPHMPTAGRGGDGVIGKGDGFKSRTSDVAHPDSHGAFESLGVDD